MKTKLLLLPLLLTSCGQQTYPFKVEEHYTAYLTSETQEQTHDPYLAYCKLGANECFIEVPQYDTRTYLNLVYTGYLITYKIDIDNIYYTVSNNGWKLA